MSQQGRGWDRREFLAASAGAVAAAMVPGRVLAAAPQPRIVVARGAAKMPANEAAYARLKAALERLGGFADLIKGKRVLVKINGTDKTSQDANTSTAMAAAVLRVVKDTGGAKSVAVIGQEWDGYDCPRAGQPTLRQVVKDAGVDLLELTHWWLPTTLYARNVPKGGGWKELWVAKAISEPDTVLLNVPRLKTHAFTLYTGCVKNIIGLTWHMYAFHCVDDRNPKAGASDKHPSRVKGWRLFPGKLSAAYHEIFRPRIALNILDAGEPTFGWGGPAPERIATFPANAVIVGTDAMACDAYGMHLLHQQRPDATPEALDDWTKGDGPYVKNNTTGGNYLAECQKLGAGQADLSKVKVDEVTVA